MQTGLLTLMRLKVKITKFELSDEVPNYVPDQFEPWNRKFSSESVHPKSHYVSVLYRGSYMSAHVLLNLLNELGKRDKMRGLPSILSLFRNEFNKFNNTRARMLDSIYHMIKSYFCRKNVIILSLCTQRCYRRHNVSRKSINH